MISRNNGILVENAMEKTDAELVKLALANQDYFLYIVKRYKIKLLHYIRRITNVASEDAEDILQEVFIKVYLNLNDFAPDLKFSSWIYRIAHNEVISNYRKVKARPQNNSVNLEDLEILNLTADLDFAKDVDQVILKKKITRILTKLERKYREILVLKFFEDKSYEEISDIIARPMGTVASLMNKAKKEFKKEFAKQNIKI